MKQFYSRYINLILLGAFFNLYLTPIYAMGDEDLTDKHPLIVVQKSDIPYVTLDVEKGHKTPQIFFQKLEELDPDCPLLSFPLGHLPSLEDSEWSQGQRWGITGVSVVAALVIGCAQWDVFNYNGAIPVMFGIGSPGERTFFPPNFVLATTAAGVLRLPGAYMLTQTVLKKTFSKNRGHLLPEEGFWDNLKYVGFVFVGSAGLAGKSLFAFIEPNVTNALPVRGAEVFASIMGGGWFYANLARSYFTMDGGWRTICEKKERLGQRYKHWRNPLKELKIKPEEEYRDQLRMSLADGFRKLILGSDRDAKDLYGLVGDLHTAFLAQTQELQSKIKDLRAKVKATPNDVGQEKELKKAEQTFHGLKVLKALLLLKSLKDFAPEEEFRYEDRGYFQNHPWWYYAMEGVGVAIAGAASGAMWYGWQYVLGTMTGFAEGHTSDDDDAGTFQGNMAGLNTGATIIVTAYIPYVALACKKNSTWAMRAALGYNPTQHEPFIADTTVAHHGREALKRTYTTLASTYLSFPAGAVGGDGLGQAGIVPLTFPGIMTFAPNLAATGLGLEVGAERATEGFEDLYAPFVQSGLSIEDQKQALANLYGAFDQWIHWLKRGRLVKVRDMLAEGFLEQYMETQTQTVKPEESSEGGVTAATGGESAPFAASEATEASKKPTKKERKEGPSSASSSPTTSSGSSLLEPLLERDPSDSSRKGKEGKGGALQSLRNLLTRNSHSPTSSSGSSTDVELENVVGEKEHPSPPLVRGRDRVVKAVKSLWPFGGSSSPVEEDKDLDESDESQF